MKFKRRIWQIIGVDDEAFTYIYGYPDQDSDIHLTYNHLDREGVVTIKATGDVHVFPDYDLADVIEIAKETFENTMEEPQVEDYDPLDGYRWSKTYDLDDIIGYALHQNDQEIAYAPLAFSYNPQTGETKMYAMDGDNKLKSLTGLEFSNVYVAMDKAEEWFLDINHIDDAEDEPEDPLADFEWSDVEHGIFDYLSQTFSGNGYTFYIVRNCQGEYFGDLDGVEGEAFYAPKGTSYSEAVTLFENWVEKYITEKAEQAEEEPGSGIEIDRKVTTEHGVTKWDYWINNSSVRAVMSHKIGTDYFVMTFWNHNGFTGTFEYKGQVDDAIEFLENDLKAMEESGR